MNRRTLDIPERLSQSRIGLTESWSPIRFESAEQSEFARSEMERETQSGVRTLAALVFAPMLAAAIAAAPLGLGSAYLYGFLALAALAAHVFLSSRAIREIEALYLLGMVLLVVSGTTFVLIAHRTGEIGPMIFASVGLLFMAIPAMPWGLREGTIASAMIFGLFTGSTWSVVDRFSSETLWTLQLFMAASVMVSLTLVARMTLVRRDELSSRFSLQGTHRELEILSVQDPLTGVWNRRYLEREFAALMRSDERKAESLSLALVDLNQFKRLNDQFGHLYGDRVLCWVARALEHAAEEGGFVSRVGGDEFVCVFVGGDPCERMQRSFEALEDGFRAAGELDRAMPTFSAGIVRIASDRILSLEKAYKAADNALYECKRSREVDQESCSLISLSLDSKDVG